MAGQYISGSLRSRRKRSMVAPGDMVWSSLAMPSDLLHYATYFDRHYLTRGLALYSSLARHSPPFRLWVLCLDPETYRVLSRLRLERMTLIDVAELEEADPALLAVKPDREPIAYYFTCTAAYLHHLFRQQRIDLLTYLDADLFFFDDPTTIYEELGRGSILVIDHRYSERAYRRTLERFGWAPRLNLGLTMLRRDDVGEACVARWREQCLESCSSHHQPGSFGDQGYMQEWPDRYRNVVISENLGAGLAPWNVASFTYRSAGDAIFVEQDPLIVYHFNRLRIVTSWLYDPGLWVYKTRLTPLLRDRLYVPYVRELRRAKQLVEGVGGRVPSIDNLRHGRSKVRSLSRMFQHGSFLLVTDRLVAAR